MWSLGLSRQCQLSLINISKFRLNFEFTFGFFLLNPFSHTHKHTHTKSLEGQNTVHAQFMQRWCWHVCHTVGRDSLCKKVDSGLKYRQRTHFALRIALLSICWRKVSIGNKSITSLRGLPKIARASVVYSGYSSAGMTLSRTILMWSMASLR